VIVAISLPKFAGNASYIYFDTHENRTDTEIKNK